MIERFSISIPANVLAKRFLVEEPTSYFPKYNGAPSQLFPVITADNPKGISFFYWGLPPSLIKNKPVAERVINMRAEDVHEKPSVKKKILSHRCIVPSDGFYAWKKIGKKTLVPWRFMLTNKDVFGMAGVWEEYENDEKTIHTFSLITVFCTEPSVQSITSRIPLILRPEQEKIWIKKELSEEELRDILDGPTCTPLEGYTISPQLNSITIDNPSLILPMPATDQYGNLTLFD